MQRFSLLTNSLYGVIGIVATPIYFDLAEILRGRYNAVAGLINHQLLIILFLLFI